MRVVCDTNVILSGIIFGGNSEKILNSAHDDAIRIYLSAAILLECAKKLKEKFSWKETQIIAVVTYLGFIATIIKPVEKVNIIKKDPDDNRILECALAAKANYIVSGDKKHLLPLKTYQKIRIVSPAQFVSDVLYA